MSKDIREMEIGELAARAHELAQMRSWSGQDMFDHQDIDALMVDKFGLDPRAVKETGKVEFLMYGDAYTFYQEPILAAFKELRLNEHLDKTRPLVVDVYSSELFLLHRVVLNGRPSAAVNDLLPRKAATVYFTGRRIPDAIEAAPKMGVTLLGGWVPAGSGTDFFGAAPFKVDGVIQLIVAVSGQDHKLVDQAFADAIVDEFGKIEIISVG